MSEFSSSRESTFKFVELSPSELQGVEGGSVAGGELGWGSVISFSAGIVAYLFGGTGTLNACRCSF
jgi:hypothetical protein